VRAKEANDRSKKKSDESKHGKELYQNSLVRSQQLGY